MWSRGGWLLRDLEQDVEGCKKTGLKAPFFIRMVLHFSLFARF
jgi:hypothetical protein